MKMNFLILIFLTASISSFAKVGGVDGGGGRSVVCRNADGTIKSAEILDLFEGRIVYKLNYTESDVDWSLQIDDLIKKSGLYDNNYRMGYGIRNWIPLIKNNMALLSDDTQLNEVDDSNEAIAPVGCKIEQAVNYINDNLILFNGLIWKSLSPTQKAALILHEAIYRNMRSEVIPEKNSARSRHFNAYLFSGKRAESPFVYELGQKYISCQNTDPLSKKTILQAVKNTNNETVFYFTYLNDRQMLTKLVLKDYLMYDGSRSDIYDQLIVPTQRTTLSGKTQSGFESNDKIHINITKADQFGPTRVYLHGISSIDNSEFETYMSCREY